MVSLTMGMVWPRLTMVRFSKHRGISAGITTIPQEMMAIKGAEFPPWFQASNRLWSWWNWPRMMKHWYYHQILYHQISPDIYHQIGIYNDNYHQVLDFIYPKWPWFFWAAWKIWSAEIGPGILRSHQQRTLIQNIWWAEPKNHTLIEPLRVVPIIAGLWRW